LAPVEGSTARWRRRRKSRAGREADEAGDVELAHHGDEEILRQQRPVRQKVLHGGGALSGEAERDLGGLEWVGGAGLYGSI
jgi:hypothetical protein